MSLVALLVAAFASAQEPEKAAKVADVWSVVVSKDGKIVVGSAGWWDRPGEIGVWEFESRKPLQRYEERLGVSSVALSSDGKLLASGSWTGRVKVFDWAANKLVADFDGGGVTRVAFSPDDKLLASASEHKTLRLWDVKGLKLHASLQGELMRFLCVVFSPDGKLVLAGGGDWKPGGVNQVVIWDVETQQQVMKLVGHNNAVVCMTYSPDANTIATGGVDQTIRFWDAKSGKPLKTLAGHNHWVEALQFTADGKTLISSSHDRTIRFWDVETGTEKPGRITMPGSVRTILLTSNGAMLLAGGGPKILKLIDTATKADVAYLWNGDDEARPKQVELAPMPVVIQPKVAMDQMPIAAPERPPSNRGWLIVGLIVFIVIACLFAAIGALTFLLRRG